MSAAQDAARFARRLDFELIAYADVGLPSWRLRVRCELLARKRISAIDEVVLRAVKIGVGQRQDLSIMLGLDDAVLDATVGALLAEDWVQATGEEEISLTDKGRAAEQAAALERPEERTVRFDFDGLLRRPLLLDLPLEPSQLIASGAREIPASPARRPDESELREHQAELQRLIRSFRRKDRELGLLAIKEVVRRERVFRDATALLFRALHGNELRLAFVLDGELSAEHESAFAQAQLLDRIGLAPGVRSRARHPALLDTDSQARYNAAAEQAARERVRLCAEQLETAATPGGEAARALRLAARELDRLPVRVLECHEHPGLLEHSLRSAKREVSLCSRRITAAVLERDLVDELRRALERGVRVRIGYGLSRDPTQGLEEGARERLKRLASDYPALEIAHLGSLKTATLVRDEAFAAVTNFPLLSHRGDATRPLGDERGWLVRDPHAVAAQRSEWETRWRQALPWGERRQPAPAHHRGARRRQTRRRSKPST